MKSDRYLSEQMVNTKQKNWFLSVLRKMHDIGNALQDSYLPKRRWPLTLKEGEIVDSNS